MLPKKLGVEFIGTFFFILVIGSAVIGGAGNLAPLAIGSALMCMVYAGGHISGGHYNPAVSLGLCIRGAHPWAELVPYWVAQVIGAAAAGGVVIFLHGANETAATLDVGKSLVAELLFTFALVWVVLNTATAKANEGNSHYGLAIGFTVLIGAYAVGGISGGTFNPAVAVGVAVCNLISWSDIWIHLAADFAGGALAGVAFKALCDD
ncbi:MAG: aquaporin [Proteobacteria bacterium]|nr:aquaporin [Pseudomonadota bacterium]